MGSALRALLKALLLAVLIGAAGQSAAAEIWPTRPVRWILAQPSGASVDIAARLLAERLTRIWGQQVVVDNRPGGQSVIGAQAAARAAGDGYNFFLATTAPLVTNPFTFKALPYDPARDFTPVANIGWTPFVVVVNATVPARSVAELVTLVKMQPGKLALAHQGRRSLGGIISQALIRAAGIELVQVPYTVQGIAIQDAIGGRVQALVLSSGTLTPFMKRGELRPLAVTSSRRVPGLDVPTIAETFAGFNYVGWYALVAPRIAPAAIARKVNRDLDLLLADPEIAGRLRDFGIYTEGAGTLEEAGRFLRVERERWGKTIRAIGIELE
jgi:tripartite-type tricarboxylate transporter receptor subunit TctC